MATAWPSITHLTAEALLVVDLLDRCQDSLFPAEAVLTHNVTKARLRELMAGRSTARLALQLFGMEPAPILQTKYGAPAWPQGFCGSLSHSHKHIAVLLARSSHFTSVGVDIEDGRPLGAAISTTVVTTRELQVVSRAGWEALGSTAEGLAFSAKEAVFKCQFPITLDTSLDFLDVRLKCGKFANTLAIQTVGSSRPRLTAIQNLINIHALNSFGVTIVYALLDR